MGLKTVQLGTHAAGLPRLGCRTTQAPCLAEFMNGNDDNGLSGLQSGLTRTVRVEGTNVVRVPFGVRRARRRRPQRPDHWATLVLPFQAAGVGNDPNPPQAA